MVIYSNNKKDTIETKKVRSGENIKECVSKESVYEVHYSSLILTINSMLKIKGNTNLIFIEPAVLFLAYMVDRKLKNTMLIKGMFGFKILR